MLTQDRACTLGLQRTIKFRIRVHHALPVGDDKPDASDEPGDVALDAVHDVRHQVIVQADVDLRQHGLEPAGELHVETGGYGGGEWSLGIHSVFAYFMLNLEGK